MVNAGVWYKYSLASAPLLICTNYCFRISFEAEIRLNELVHYSVPSHFNPILLYPYYVPATVLYLDS